MCERFSRELGRSALVHGRGAAGATVLARKPDEVGTLAAPPCDGSFG